jgi:hypothetical protein
MAKEIESEEKVAKERELCEGEAAALRLAMEERKRVQAAAEAKREIEERDSRVAKEVYDEEKKYADIQSLCEKDDDVARQLYDEELAKHIQDIEEVHARNEKKKLDELALEDEEVITIA